MGLNRPLVLAAYGILALVVLTPLVETAIAVRPYQPSTAAWRFGAVGVFSRATIVPLFGMLLMSGLAVGLGHRRVLRGISIVLVPAVVVLLLASGSFVLDVVQLRGAVRTELRSAYDISSVVALFTMLVVAVGSALLSVGTWIGSRRRRGEAPRSGKQPSILIRK